MARIWIPKETQFYDEWWMWLYECENKIELVVDTYLQNIPHEFVYTMCLFKLVKKFSTKPNILSMIAKKFKEIQYWFLL